jgi:trk system potassium uptake protein TrkA
VLIGFGFDRDCLEAAQIKDAKAVAAVTSGDNTNILTARIARENYGIENVVARIYDPRRAVIYQRLGIPTVATVTWTTDQAIRRLFPDRSNTEWTDPSGDMMLVEFALPGHLVGKRLASLNETGTRSVVTVTRANAIKLVTDVTVGQEGDVVRLIVQRSNLPAVNTLFHRREMQ